MDVLEKVWNSLAAKAATGKPIPLYLIGWRVMPLILYASIWIMLLSFHLHQILTKSWTWTYVE